MATNTTTIGSKAAVADPTGKSFVVVQGGVVNRLSFSNLQSAMRADYTNGIKCISIGYKATMAELKAAILAAVQSLSQDSVVCAIKIRASNVMFTTANFTNDSFAITSSYDFVGIIICPYNTNRFVVKFTSPFTPNYEWNVVYGGDGFDWGVYKNTLEQA